jgi:hypothetical protein
MSNRIHPEQSSGPQEVSLLYQDKGSKKIGVADRKRTLKSIAKTMFRWPSSRVVSAPVPEQAPAQTQQPAQQPKPAWNGGRRYKKTVKNVAKTTAKAVKKASKASVKQSAKTSKHPAKAAKRPAKRPAKPAKAAKSTKKI